MDLAATSNFLTGSREYVRIRRPTFRGMYIEVRCAARVVTFSPEAQAQINAAGGIAQSDRRCIISNKEIERWQWPGPPRRSDVLIIEVASGDTVFTQIQGCDSSCLPGGVVVRHDLTIRGGNA